jgi:hypothetical protein
MTKMTAPKTGRRISRRKAVSGLALGGAGLLGTGLAGGAAASGHVQSLDLDDPADNCTAVLKMQADISGADAMGGFPGEVWAWVPGESNLHLFNTYGVGVSHVEFDEAANGWKFYHREALLYLDRETGDVIDHWYNPFTQRNVEVLQILNDHVSRFYALDGGPFPFPWTYEVHGDSLVFRISVFRLEDNPLTRKDYPRHSQGDYYQTGELWGMIGRLSEVMNPDVTSASCVTSWSRISGWLPFMEMGARPGQIIYHSHSYKLRDGAAELPVKVRDWLEKNAPEYFESPREWTTPQQRIGVWGYSKNLIDERRAKGLAPGQTPFGWPKD